MMIHKEDWDDVYRKLIAAGQSRVAPPTFEEVEALSGGSLSEAEAERVREALSCHPELMRVFTEPFPAEAEGVLTEEEIASDLAKIRERVRRPAGAAPVVAPARWQPSRTFAIAAGVIIAIAIGAIALRRWTTEPRVVVTQIVYPEGIRGGRRGVPAEAPVTLSNDVDYDLQLVYESRQAHGEYRLELLDLSTDPPRRVWLREHVSRRPDNMVSIRLDTDDFEPGIYRFVLSGDGDSEPLAEYTIRIAPHGEAGT